MARRRLLTLTAATLGASLLAGPASAGPIGDLVRDVEDAVRPVTELVEDVAGQDVVGDVVDVVDEATDPVDEVLDGVADELAPEPEGDVTPAGDQAPAPAAAPAAAPPAAAPSVTGVDAGVRAAGIGDPTAFDPLMLGKSHRSAGYQPLGNSLAPRPVETPQVAPPESGAPQMVELAAPAPAAGPSVVADLAADGSRPLALELLAVGLLGATALAWSRRRVGQS